MDEMDALEQMSWDLEFAQQKRFKKAKHNDAFWNTTELEIFETIKTLRNASRTFDPNTPR